MSSQRRKIAQPRDNSKLFCFRNEDSIGFKSRPTPRSKFPSQNPISPKTETASRRLPYMKKNKNHGPKNPNHKPEIDRYRKAQHTPPNGRRKITKSSVRNNRGRSRNSSATMLSSSAPRTGLRTSLPQSTRGRKNESDRGHPQSESFPLLPQQDIITDITSPFSKKMNETNGDKLITAPSNESEVLDEELKQICMSEPIDSTTLKKGEILITVEHCMDHSLHSLVYRHQSKGFQDKAAKLLHKCKPMIGLPLHKVKVQAIPSKDFEDFHKWCKEWNTDSPKAFINRMGQYEFQIGAFEVKLDFLSPTEGMDLHSALIHSRLETGEYITPTECTKKIQKVLAKHSFARTSINPPLEAGVPVYASQGPYLLPGRVAGVNESFIYTYNVELLDGEVVKTVTRPHLRVRDLLLDTNKMFAMEEKDVVVFQKNFNKGLRAGLGWGNQEPPIDLDLSCLYLDSKYQCSEEFTLSFQKLVLPGTTHSGDNLEGTFEGDGEWIDLDLPSIPEHIHHLVFTVHIFTENKMFAETSDSYIRMIGPNDQTMVIFRLDASITSRGLMFAVLSRRAQDQWSFEAIGLGISGQTASDSFKDIEDYMRKKQNPRDMVPKYYAKAQQNTVCPKFGAQSRYSPFISHKKFHSKNGQASEMLAEKLYCAFKNCGRNPFYDKMNLETIAKEALIDAVKNSDSMVIILDDETAQSEWCKLEWEAAHKAGIPIFTMYDQQYYSLNDFRNSIAPSIPDELRFILQHQATCYRFEDQERFIRGMDLKLPYKNLW